MGSELRLRSDFDLKSFTAFPTNESLGLGIINDDFAVWVPLDFSTYACGNSGQVTG